MAVFLCLGKPYGGTICFLTWFCYRYSSCIFYVQALLFGNAPTKGLQVMKKQGNSEELVSACQNGVHPELSRSDSTLDQTCFTQTVLKLNKGESIEMHTTAQAIEVGTGTFFGLVKLSGI